MLICTFHSDYIILRLICLNVLKLSRSFETQWNLLCWKYKINEFYFGYKHKIVSFKQTTKKGTFTVIIIIKNYNVTLYMYMHCQIWPSWHQSTAQVYFKGDKSWHKYIKITQENLCHRYSARGKSFEAGIVPVARYSHPLSRVLFKNSTHWLSNQNTTFSYVMYYILLWTSHKGTVLL